MNRFDSELREALRRTKPPPGLAERVLARTSGINPRSNNSLWRWSMAAAAVLALIVGAALYKDYQTRAEGQRAKEQVMLALRVTGSEMREIQDRLSRIQQRVIKPPAK